MWKDIIEFIEKVSKDENNKELMTYYLEYVINSNPFKNVNCSPPCQIINDLISAQNIKKSKANDTESYAEILKHKFKSAFFKEKIENCKQHSTGMQGINDVFKEAEKYIEMAFILKSVEKIHRYERMKYIVATLIAILTLVVSIKISIIKIG